MSKVNPLPFAALAALSFFASACASYAVPGRAADLAFLTGSQDPNSAIDTRALKDVSLQDLYERRPTVSFPASIAVVRLQAPDYSSYTVRETAGTGNFTVVTQRDVESEESFERLRTMPEVAGVATLNRLVVPQTLKSDLELRKVAAQLHADVLLFYTLDTTYEIDDESWPLTVLSLGLLPTQEVEVSTTASAVMLDTRSGYLYGLAEKSAEHSRRTSAWVSEEKLDDARRATEREAFDGLVGEIGRTWSGVVAHYSPVRAVLPTQ